MSSVEQFNYRLPKARIAQHPIEPRDAARLLDATETTNVRHRQVRDLAELVRPGDALVVNDTRVLHARLILQKPTGGRVEVLLVEPEDQDEVGAQGRTVSGKSLKDRPPKGAGRAWRALVKPGKRVTPGTILNSPATGPVVEVGEHLGDGLRRVVPAGPMALDQFAEVHGDLPLPPYIREPLRDPNRYQTVYSATTGSVAAPTAGLHLTQDLISACQVAGAQLHKVELTVGLGTFRPIMVDDIEEHRMHAESFQVPETVLEACRTASRVLAVGTTTVRALESAATLGTNDGSTELFIKPGYDWKLVDVMMTNFHQPRSSLLVMLAAFCGEQWRSLYAAALQHEYRFLSFGDAMIVSRST